MFDFAFYCGVRLVAIERSTSVNYKLNDWFGRQHCIFGSGYFGDLGFIILFVGILPLYAINLGAVSLFADSPFTFLAMFVLMYTIDLSEW